MTPASFDRLGTVLCLGAHADDIEIGCGGTLCKWMQQFPGLSVYWVVFSANEQRAAEARCSADRLLQSAGDQSVQVFNFRDSFFPYQAEAIKEAIHAIASEVTPDVVFTHRLDDAHQDHRVISELTWCAFRNHAILEYEIPKYEGDLGRPNILVELSAEHAVMKVDHLVNSFPSQASKPWYDEETFRSILRLRGLECHASSRYAEGFYARKLVM